MNSKYITPKLKKVTTVSGDLHLLKNCKLINKKYYKIGNNKIEGSGDIFHLLSEETGMKRWYKANTRYIIYDHRQKMYILRRDLQVIVEDGIIDFDKNLNPIFGSFSQDLDNPFTTQVCIDNKIYICMSIEKLKKNNRFLEAISDGIYYQRNSIPALYFTEPISCSKDYKNSLVYDSKNITKKYKEYFNNSYKPNYYPQVEEYQDVLNGLSFGVEFETTKGKIPDSLCKNLGLIPLRDGSIEGLEYVTIPHSGKKGIQALLDSLKQLEKRTRYDNNCSLHIHIGNIPRSEEFFIALYKVLFIIQDEIYDMFPFFKKKNLGVKKKHYTKPLPLGTMLKLDNKINKNNLTENFKHIYSFLSMGNAYEGFDCDLEKVTTHPTDPHGNQKWNIRTRYHWVNLIPLLFGNKQTVEFRIHTPTYDANKVMHYLFLCASIINFTKKNLGRILKDSNTIANLTLHDIVLNSPKSKGNYLVRDLSSYIDSRKEFVSRCLRNGDILSPEDKFYLSPRFIDWSGPQKIKEETIKTPFSFSENSLVQQFQNIQVNEPDE